MREPSAGFSTGIRNPLHRTREHLIGARNSRRRPAGKITKTRQVFVGHYHCSYVSPKGKKVDSMRPFGSGIFDEDGTKQSRLVFRFGEFKTAGQSGIAVTSAGDQNFSFNAPASYTTDMPWTRTITPKERKQLDKDPKKRYQFLSSAKESQLTRKAAIEWLEKHAKSLNQVKIKALSEDNK